MRLLPCVAGGQGQTVAAHLRKFTDGGMGIKPSDCYVLPLSVEQHNRQHQVGELTFWGGEEGMKKAIDWARKLYDAKDIFEAQRIVIKARKDLFG